MIATMDAEGFHMHGQMQVLFLDGYKGVRQDIKDPDQDFEIYEVSADPGERNNLAGTDGKFSELNQKMKDRVMQLRRANPSCKRPYDRLAVPAANVVEGDLLPGLRWHAVKGDSPWVPRLSDQNPGEVIESTTLAAKLPAGSTSVCRGFLKVPKDGDYAFHLQTNGKAIVRIHQAILIDADFGYSGSERGTTISLKAGSHPITLTVSMAEDVTAPEFSFNWTVADLRSEIPAAALYSKNVGR